MIERWVRFVAGALCLGLSGAAASAPSFDFGWLLFGDVYYDPSNHLEEGDGAGGAVARRIYLTLDGEFSEAWFGRLRYEANQSGQFEVYDFTGIVKDAYLGREFGRQRLLFGLSSTPTFDLVESIWGMRYLARTPMDLQGVASRDTGVSSSGPLTADGAFSYRAMVGSRVTFGADKGDEIRWMGALTWSPRANWTIDLYADTESVSGPHDRTTLQAFAAYQTEPLRWGLLYSHQDREQDPGIELASVFVVAALDESRSLFARVDRLFEPSPKGNDIAYLPYDPTARATTLFTGVEFSLSPQVRLTPNVVYTRYDPNDSGDRPRSDLYLRLTLFLDFE